MPAGTIALTGGSVLVAGSGTRFTSELRAGDFVYVTVGDAPYTIVAAQVISDEQITLADPFDGPSVSGLAWTAVPALMQVAITQKVINDFGQVARGRILDFQNWQKIYSDDPSVTVTRPDRTEFTGPSWGHIAKVVDAVEDPLKNLVPLSRQYMTLAAAQADIANIPAGSSTYVRSQNSLLLADEYINNGGVLAATGRSLPAYESVRSIAPLSQSTVFKDGAAGEFELGLSFDTALIDSQNNILSYTAGGQQYFLLASSFPLIKAASLEVDGKQVDANGILAVQDKENVESLSLSTTYRSLDNDGEFAFGPRYDTVTLDSQGNVMRYTKGSQEFSLLAGNYPALFINGVPLDAGGMLPSADRENLTTLSGTTRFSSSSSEFAFNQKSWVLTDQDRNILFDADDYLERSSKWDVAYEKSQEITPQKTNPFAPWSQVDSAGKYQVSVTDTVTGKQVQVTAGSSNETAPRPEGLDGIVWQSDRADPPPGGLFFARAPDFRAHAYTARPRIVGWGHSFINNGAFLRRLYELSGVPTFNFGLSGQMSDAIASRQGGAPSYYAPAGGVIPASGAVNLTPAAPGPLRGLAAPVPLKCSLAGVDGVFTWDGSNAVFTRDAAGQAVTVGAALPLYIYPVTTTTVQGSTAKDTLYTLHDECINLFWIGRNNLSETELIISNLTAMVEGVKNIGKKIVVLGEFNSASEVTGSAGFAQMTELNRRYRALYPQYYCEINGTDIRQNFLNHANPASAGDMADVASGVTPRSLRYDTLHPSQALSGNGGSLTPDMALEVGANVNAEFVYQFIKNKGWL
ncbi:hypothetical protein [Pantoea anthophila]|uniref:hypothetical protein n=1 Tax=Pantoea anthophila TaxID=470931 RepID=UPI00277FAF83|nr:hypothetical protein [Pantoea anthophila]MDQ1214594.1 hypothetical protein [Pantoea anthophila]